MLVGISVWCKNTISGNMNDGKGLFYFFLIADIFQRDELLDMVCSL